METPINQHFTKHPIQLYIKEISVDGRLQYSYTFPKNNALFKWLLSLASLTYNKNRKILYSDASQDILDFIETAAKGRLRINKFHFHKHHIQQAQEKGNQNTLQRIVIPRHIYTIRLAVTLALLDQKPYYLLSTDQILACKKIFENQDFISYNRRLSAFLIPHEEKLTLKLLQLVNGKGYLAIHAHVKFNSLYLKSLLWRQSYA